MEPALKMYMENTKEKIEEIKQDIMLIEKKLDDLLEFKIQMLISAKMTSVFISTFVSIVFGLATLAVAFYKGK